MKEKIAKWYKQGLWTADMVENAVAKGVITEEDYLNGLAYLKTCYGADAYTNEELIAAF